LPKWASSSVAWLPAARIERGGRSTKCLSIALAQLKGLLADAVQLVDVLPPEEYAAEHLPGAVNVPLKQLDAETTAQLDQHRPVAVYCL
jgi:rhodanese-related sulfurtransferase